MVVSGMKTGTSYVLGRKYVRKENDGVIYAVPQQNGKMVKILNKDQRSTRERSVIDAVNGMGSIMGPEPLEPVYENGRFVGYVFEDVWDPDPVIPPAPPQKTDDSNVTVAIIACLVIGMGLSVWFYFFGFDILTGSVAEKYRTFNFGGIPMLFGGWIAMVAVLLGIVKKDVDNSTMTMILGLGAFVLACAVIYLAICAIVTLAEMAFNVAVAILPTIIVIAIILYVVKSFLR